jgi:hypothetical protein
MCCPGHTLNVAPSVTFRKRKKRAQDLPSSESERKVLRGTGIAVDPAPRVEPFRVRENVGILADGPEFAGWSDVAACAHAAMRKGQRLPMITDDGGAGWDAVLSLPEEGHFQVSRGI